MLNSNELEMYREKYPKLNLKEVKISLRRISTSSINKCSSSITKNDETNVKINDKILSQEKTSDERSSEAVNENDDQYILPHDDFKCTKCLRQFSDQNILLQHLIECRMKDSNIPIVINSEINGSGTFVNKFLVSLHKCEFCDKAFLEKQKLIEHANTHKLKKFYIKCHICYARFFSIPNLKKHLSFHNEERKFQCHICPKSFYTDPQLKVHIKLHTEKTTLKCELCCKEFSNVTNLKKHFISHSDQKNKSAENKNKIKCEICESTYSRPDHLKRHMKTHTNTKAFKCGFCNKDFHRKEHLINHVETHKNKNNWKLFHCDFCDLKAFFRLGFTKNHLLKLCSEKMYVCNICNAEFAQKEDFRNHLKTHPDEKTYKCSFCEKSFKRKFVLSCHMRIHKIEKQFKCNGCNQTFVRERLLKIHLTTVHNIKDGESSPMDLNGEIEIVDLESDMNVNSQDCAKIILDERVIKNEDLPI